MITRRFEPGLRPFGAFYVGMLVFALSIVGLGASPAFAAAPITVPGDWPTIQQAIDHATSGDIIIVSPDTYHENIRFGGKSVALRSTNPTSAAMVAATIIDGVSSDSVVTFQGTEPTTCVLSGFTITHGRSNNGGGIRGNGTLATITYNDISSNSATTGGGLHGCNGAIEYNRIRDNVADDSHSGGEGGGLADCHGIIRNNEISNNSAHGPESSGGGLYVCAGTIENNVISGNTASASDHGRGGGLSSCGGTIQNNTISSNTAGGSLSGYGGGIDYCGGTIQGNIITHNAALSSMSGGGGGLYECHGLIRNNTISGNRAGGRGGHGGGLSYCGGTIQENTICGNRVGGMSAGGGGLSGCHGTIQDNIICSNTVGGLTSGSGGGIGGSNAAIRNNTISFNTVSANYASGGGMANCDNVIENNTISNNLAVGDSSNPSSGGGVSDCDATIRNNTICGNTADNGAGLGRCAGTIRNCIVWDNETTSGQQIEAGSVPSYSCIQGWSGGGTGNITDDPLLADPANGDLHIVAVSPCIDAGGTVPLTVDFEGDPRPVDVTAIPLGDGSDIDIGADEYVSTPVLAIEPASLSVCAREGTNAATQTLRVWNRGEGVITQLISTTPNWLGVVPSIGFSADPGEPVEHKLFFNTASLAAGDYAGTITIHAPLAPNSPAIVPVRLKVGSVVVIPEVGGGPSYAGGLEEVVWESHGPCDQVVIDVHRPGYKATLATVANQEGMNSVTVQLPPDLEERDDYRFGVAWDCCPDVVFGEGQRLIVKRLVFLVTSPISGATWQAGTAGIVTWACAGFPGPGEVHADLWKADALQRRLGTVPMDNGSNHANITLPPGPAPDDDYRISLTWTQNEGIRSWSEYFTVTPAPALAVTWPSAGSVWQRGTVGDLSFTAANLPGPGEVWVELWQRTRKIASMGKVPCQEGANVVQVQLPAGVSLGLYQIRLFWAENTAVQALSGTFLSGRTGAVRWELYR